MRRLSAICLLVASGACAHPAPPAVSANPQAVARLAAADRMLEAGCYDCLVGAYREFEGLRVEPSVARAAELGTIESAVLVSQRERELGMADGGYLEIARTNLSRMADAPFGLPTVLEVAGLLPGSSLGPVRPPATDDELTRARTLRANREAYQTTLRDLVPGSLPGTYTWASFMCGSIDQRDVEPQQIFDAATERAALPILEFRRATCRDLDPGRLGALLAHDPRFLEVNYLLGRIAVGRRDLDDAQKLFEQAYAWHPRWPSLTVSLANVMMTAEDFDAAARYYGEALALDPLAAEAKLGRVRALTYLGRHADAIETTGEMLASRWYVGDAHYWRALNETQTEQYDAAWIDVEEAGKLLMNAEVPKLAGIVAYRRHELDVARDRFETSRARNSTDCETSFYLGLVLADERQWPRTADVLVATAQCVDAMEQRLVQEIAQIRASADPPARQERQIVRRERDIANGRRMRATSWFNVAVAYFSLSQPSAAREYAERVADDEQFGERAREILARVK